MMRDMQRARGMSAGAQTAAPPPPQADAGADTPIWCTHMERMFEKQGQRTEGLLIQQDRMISMLGDTLLTTAKRMQTRMQSLGEVFERKLTHIGDARTAKRNEDIKRVEDRQTCCGQELRGAQAARREGRPAARWFEGHPHNRGLRRQPLQGRVGVQMPRFLEDNSGHDKEITLDPHAPRKFGQICKVRCKDGFLSQLEWAARQI